MRHAWVVYAVAFALCAVGAQAAISFGPAGTGVLTFDDPPQTANWSTRSITGGSSSFRAAADLDAAIQTNNAALINSPVAVTHTYPPAVSALARWNDNTNFTGDHSRHFLQTRPTGNAAALLMATLQNDSGTGISYLYIAYDLNVFALDLSEGALTGHQVYYSLTGTELSWVGISALSGDTSGSLAALVDLTQAPWQPGTLLYFLWADDSSPGNGPAYTIDNVIVGRGDVRPHFAQQPANITLPQCHAATLSAPMVEGSLPMTWRWHKDGAPMDPDLNPSAIAPVLVLTNAQAVDSGTYFLRATNAFGWAESGNVSVVVTPDTTPPAIVKAQWDGFDPNKLRVTFSEPVGAEALDSQWLVESLTTGDQVLILDWGPFTSASHDQVAFLTDARDLTQRYRIIRDAELADECAGNVLAAGSSAEIVCPDRWSIAITHNPDGTVTITRNCGTLQQTVALPGGWLDSRDQSNPLTISADTAQQFYRVRE